MHIIVRCVFEEYQLLKKLCKSNKKNSDQIYENHTHLEFTQIMQNCLFNYICGTLSKHSVGDLKKIIVVKTYCWNLWLLWLFI